MYVHITFYAGHSTTLTVSAANILRSELHSHLARLPLALYRLRLVGAAEQLHPPPLGSTRHFHRLFGKPHRGICHYRFASALLCLGACLHPRWLRQRRGGCCMERMDEQSCQLERVAGLPARAVRCWRRYQPIGVYNDDYQGPAAMVQLLLHHGKRHALLPQPDTRYMLILLLRLVFRSSNWPQQHTPFGPPTVLPTARSKTRKIPAKTTTAFPPYFSIAPAPASRGLLPHFCFATSASRSPWVAGSSSL